MVALQGVVVLAFAVFYVVGQPRGSSQSTVLASAVLFVVAGAGLLLVARGLFGLRRWARSPALTWQLVSAPVVYALFQSGRWYLAAPLMLSVVLTLRGVFAIPATR